MKNEDRRITTWLNPKEKTLTKYGYISNSVWLEKEQKRINEHEWCEIIKDPFTGKMAIFYKHCYFKEGVKNEING